jgi:acyl carrier protein
VTTGTDQLWVAEAVRRIVRAVAPDPIDEVDDAQELVNNLGYNSFALVELVVALEDCFAVRTDESDDMPPVGTVRGLQEYLLGKIAAGQASVPTEAAVDGYLRSR